MLFKAKTEEQIIESSDDMYTLAYCDEVETLDGFKRANNLTLADKLITDNNDITPIKNIIAENTKIIIFI